MCIKHINIEKAGIKMEVGPSGYAAPSGVQIERERKRETRRSSATRKNAPVGGYGLESDVACPTNQTIANQIADAESFDAGFKVIVTAALSGLALHVLEPFLRDLQERFITSVLNEAAITGKTGKNRPCAALEDIDVKFYRLFENPNPGLFYNYRKSVSAENKWLISRLQNEPMAIARHIFSDIFDRNNPVPHLTQDEVEKIIEYMDQNGGSTNFNLEYAKHLIPETWEKIEAYKEEIRNRVQNAGIAEAGVRVNAFYASGSASQTGVSHYDATNTGFLPDTPDMGVLIMVPVTETLATTMRTCTGHRDWLCGEPEGPPNTETEEEDVKNVPLLQPGDAQFMRPTIHMHMGTNTRKRGCIYLMVRFKSKEIMRNIVKALAWLRSQASMLDFKLLKSLREPDE